MTDELAIYQNPPDTLHRLVTDDWFEAFGNIIKLAEYVADTEFVPDTMRRRPAAVAAAILTGREMGLAPMVALRMLYIVHGRVGQTAELMRALILRAGHELKDVEVTSTRVILEGRRRGESDWSRATFTADDAKKAGIRLGDYPADKLYARATSRIARRKFADVIAGLPSVDELEDATDLEPTADAAAGPAIQRKRPTKPAKAARTQPKPTQAPTAEPDDDIAELLGDTPQAPQPPADQNRTNMTARKRRRQDPDILPASADLSGPAPEDQTPTFLDIIDQSGEPRAEPEPDEPITKPQNAKLHALFRELGIVDQTDRHTIRDHILGYTPNTGLTRAEARLLIDTTETWAIDTNYPYQDRINDILNTAALQQAEQDEAEQEP
jgi:hypothetical protein